MFTQHYWCESQADGEDGMKPTPVNLRSLSRIPLDVELSSGSNSNNFAPYSVDQEHFNAGVQLSPYMILACDYHHTDSMHFRIDMVTVSTLAVVALLTNIGLLYLARITKPFGQVNHSSFSTTVNNGATALAAPSKRVFSKQVKWLNMFVRQEQQRRVHDETSVELPSRQLLRKCASSVSICRTLSNTVTGPSSTAHRSPRSRRHRRYLRGLLSLSISNLTVSITLIIWCACEILENEDNRSWMSLLFTINYGIADVAQALEIGAVLWIALERTLGIHWPRERKNSSPKLDSNDVFFSQSVIRTRNMTTYERFCPLFSYFAKLCSPVKITCSRCCTTSWGARRPSLSGQSMWAAILIKRLRCITRFLLSAMPITLLIFGLTPGIVNFLWQLVNVSGGQRIYFVKESVRLYLNDSNGVHLITTNEADIMNSRFVTIFYYTNAVMSALVIGQFLAPLAVLTTTNILIYRKVASRDKRFFSRQSSNTSKSSFLSLSSNFGSCNVHPPANRRSTGLLTINVPLLRVLETSSQDLTCEELEKKPLNSELNKEVPDQFHRLLVPKMDVEVNGYADKDHLPLMPRAQRRCSTSVLMCNESQEYPNDKSYPNDDEKLENLKSRSCITPQPRRKSSSDLFTTLFQNKHSDVSTNNGRVSGEEPILLQMLRRQHRRTLRILIILLLVFLVCRAPRAVVLMFGWIHPQSLCKFPHRAFWWLKYTTLWAHTSAVFDTIVYGFWGNRSYRVRLLHWFTLWTSGKSKSSQQNPNCRRES
ncbi:unnamed protein product [Calicophoron daubneyi]|uniref:G-protein coupled receptors family 1 profile domain-containing protein n=1 Tax=Calicophoron daubneyi TaxID=300641 RepID=A0AAV2TLV0_CALDB